MNQKVIVIVIVIAFILTGAGVFYLMQNRAPAEPQEIVPQPSGPAADNQDRKHIVVIKTSLGEIVFETYGADAPKTVDNFIKLASQGYFNGLTFHRVIKGFMIQGGDPNCGTIESRMEGPCGTGGPGYQFEDELNPVTPSYKEGYKRGVVAMANAGPNTNGSQFFIMLENKPLPHNYTIFGKVVEGQGVVDAIGNVKTDPSDRPLAPVVMKKVAVEQ